MNEHSITYVVSRFRLFLLIVFTASLFWCGDAECLEGTSHDNCASLVCSLLNSNNGTTNDTSNSSERDCSCVCHVPTIVAHLLAVLVSPTVVQVDFTPTLFIPDSPIRNVYHPPLTA